MKTLMPTEVNLKDYYSSKELCDRYEIALRTLSRWAKAHKNFPKPIRVLGQGRNNYYVKAEIHAFETQYLPASQAIA